MSIPIPPPLRAPAEVSAALAHLEEPVALDTEFHAEYHYAPKLMLVQLQDASGRLILIDALSSGVLPTLGSALSGKRLLVHAATMDVPLLIQQANLQPGSVVDPQVLAGFAGLGYPTGLGDLLWQVLGATSPDALSLSDWSKRPLDPQQLLYAAGDVRHLHALADALTERLGPTRRHLADQATSDLLQSALKPTDPRRLWEAIPAAEILDSPGREILRRLCIWREHLALVEDRPAIQILSNNFLVDIARRRPGDIAALLSNRKMPRGVVKRYGESLLQIVREASEVPEPLRPPSVASTPKSRAMSALLETWAAVQELRDGVSSKLLMPPSQRAFILQAAERGEPAAPLSGWRAPWSESLLDLLGGRAALTGAGSAPCLEKRN